MSKTLLTRRFRIELECRIDVLDETPEEVNERYEVARRNRHDAYEPELAAYLDVDPPSANDLEEQRMLVRALLADPEALSTWLRDIVMLHLSIHEIEGSEPLAQRERCLLPVVESLPPRQRHRFREAIARGTLLDTAEEMWNSFDHDLRLVKVEAIA